MKKFPLAPLVCALAFALGIATALPWSGAFAFEERESYCAGRGDVHFRAADGTRLIGHRFGRGKTAVVLAHQSHSSLCRWIPYARRLASKGYTAFAFDFRNNGLSQQVGYRRSGRLAADAAAAAKYMRAHGAKKVFLVGASMGGTAVLVGGANVRPPVSGVVSLSGPSSFGGVDAARAVPRLRVPVLYLAASDDAGGWFATEAQALYAATASSDKAIEILPGSDHGVSLLGYSGRAREIVEQFLVSH
jgi:pimeloyl-ACP methyl ester carboxylesterase